MEKLIDDPSLDMDVETVTHGVSDIDVQSEDEEDSGDELVRLIEASFDEPTDDEMEDVSSKVKTEQELINEAWAIRDAAIAEDPTLISKPKPTITHGFRMLKSRERPRDFADDLAEMTTSGARHLLTLWVSFDVASAPRNPLTQKRRYEVRGRHAHTMKELFDTLWVENCESLIYHGYNLQRVQRLEIKLFLKKRDELQDTRCWTICGDITGREQCEGWNQFLDVANSWGQTEALENQKGFEYWNKVLRLRCVSDHLGNLYDESGQYYKERKQSVHACVDAEIVLHLD